jgi:2-polyprenyl-3-methyl-5-hydroxy-6-metoxy-1,4-benzoquinol methylase
MTAAGQKPGRLRVLLGIASYGEKNLGFLKQIIRAYRSMAFDTDVVVFSEAPKNLGDGVRVLVGLPGKNPWSLPFAHKAFFAENVDHYDLFIYSEDDMEVSEANVHAFLRAMPGLKSDEIAGFLRYEIGRDGTKLLTDVHGAFHWKADSVVQRGPHTIAEFSNEHAGFYILTQSQLWRAIDSGGYLKAPYQGRYGLPETAATDPYTCCGFRKVILISSLGDFLIRHMSNLYVERHGVSVRSFEDQVQTLMDISRGLHPVSVLCPMEPKVLQRVYAKSYYEKTSEELRRALPELASDVLSIGYGWGATEPELKQRGARVAVLPLDSVAGVAAARSGMEVVYGSLDECLQKLEGREFDLVLLTNLLHLQKDPGSLVERCCSFVQDGGTLIIAGPNFHRFPTLMRRFTGLGEGDFAALRHYDRSGITMCGPRAVTEHIRPSGLRVVSLQWANNRRFGISQHLGRLTAEQWILEARRGA